MALYIILNETSTNDHVPDIDLNRFLQERVRAAITALPNKVLMLLLLKAIVCIFIKWINTSPRRAGIPNQSPCTLLLRTTVDVNINCRVPVGSYCHTYDGPDPTNTNTSQTTGAIALNAQGNIQGG